MILFAMPLGTVLFGTQRICVPKRIVPNGIFLDIIVLSTEFWGGGEECRLIFQ